MKSISYKGEGLTVFTSGSERIRKFGNEKMSSDKNSFLRGLTCRTNRTGLSYRRKTKNIKSELGGFLMRKGYEMGEVSL